VERNQLYEEPVGIRFAASGHNTAVATTSSRRTRMQALAVAALDSHDMSSDSRQQVHGRYRGNRAGNIPVLIERNDFINAQSRTSRVGAGA